MGFVFQLCRDSTTTLLQLHGQHKGHVASSLPWWSPGIWVVWIWDRCSQETFHLSRGNWHDESEFSTLSWGCPCSSSNSRLRLRNAFFDFWNCSWKLCREHTFRVFLPKVDLMKYSQLFTSPSDLFSHSAKAVSVCFTVRYFEQSW